MAHITDPPVPTGTYVAPAVDLLAFMRAGEDTFPAFTVTNAFNFANGALTLAPIYVPRAVTALRLAVNITVGGSAGALIRMGIWNDDGTGKPSTLVVDGGAVAATAVAYTTAAISQALGSGLYWVGAVSQGAPATTPTITYASAMAQQQSGPSGSFPGPATCWSLTGVTGALGSAAAAVRGVNPGLVAIGI